MPQPVDLVEMNVLLPLHRRCFLVYCKKRSKTERKVVLKKLYFDEVLPLQHSVDA